MQAARSRSFGPDADFSGADVIVDGIFGTGLARAVEGEAAALIERVNASGRPVLAIDIPSGLSADTGMRLGAAIRADATVSLVAWKRGLFTGDAADCVGARELAPLDVPAAAYARVAPDATLIAGLPLANARRRVAEMLTNPVLVMCSPSAATSAWAARSA